MVEFYRVDSWPRMKRVLITGPSVLTLGGLVIAISFMTRHSRDLRLDACVIGFFLVAGAAIYTMFSMQRILRDDVYLALRTDGLVVQSSGSETLVAWDDLEAARWDAARAAVVLERTGGEPLVLDRPFAKIEGAALAQRIVAVRRKIAMNLIR